MKQHIKLFFLLVFLLVSLLFSYSFGVTSTTEKTYFISYGLGSPYHKIAKNKIKAAYERAGSRLSSSHSPMPALSLVPMKALSTVMSVAFHGLKINILISAESM